MNRYPQKTNSSLLIYIISIFFIFLVSTTEAYAATYYISSTDGDDTCTGLSQSPYTTGVTACPIKTLTKLNTKTFSPGDSILFKKGDTFYGSITVSQSGTAGNPITFSSYGSGEKPIITGFTDVTSWTNLGNNIWESTNAVSTLSYLNIVLIGNTNTPMGRIPNGLNYYTYQSHNANLSITSSDLTGTPNWTGAMAVIRKNFWTWQQSTITSQSGGTISYTDIGTSHNPNNNYNFFIQNDIRTLDNQNEWYYNPTTKKISIYSSSQPVNVKVPTINKTMTGSSRHYITLDGLTFDGANSSGVWFDNSSYIDIINSNFNNTGQFGVYFYATQYNTVDNSTFNNNNWSALTSSDNSNYITYTNNNIENTFLIQGVGTGSIAAIQAGADNILIQNNVINNSGYNGMMVTSNHGLVKNNFVNNSLLRSSDGGGIYTAGANIDLVIESNIFANGYGFPVGVGDILGRSTGAVGIYLDINASNTTVKNNTVLNNKTGIYLNQGTDNNTITSNLTYNNKFEFEINNNNTSPDLEGSVFNNVVTDNIFVSKDSKDPSWWKTSLNVYLSSPWGNADILKFISNSDRNYYVTPSSDLSMFEVYLRNPSLETFYTFDQWKVFTSHDANSKYLTFSSPSDIFFDYNATTSNKTVSLPWPVVDMDGNKVTGNVTILPYRSVIYLKDPSPNTVDSLPPSISSFTIPTTSTSLAISITTLSATDSTGVTGYLLNETGSTPSAGSGPWSSTPPTSYTFTTQGTKTLYAFAKDLAGNVSLSSSDTITITLPVVTPPAGGGGGGGASSTTTITCPTGTTLVNTTCVTNTTTSATLIDKAKQKDIKPDGSINIIDFNIIMANWNKTYT